jgi:predicted protein tyrosine phosphatase
MTKINPGTRASESGWCDAAVEQPGFSATEAEKYVNELASVLHTMEFLVTDRRTIESGIVVKTPYIVISIRDPERPRARLRRPPAFMDALFLAFHDAEPAGNMLLPKGIRLMSRQDADNIWSFVQSHLGRTGTIVCHCEQGMSRSPAVALALAEALQGDVDTILAESQPNQYVYRLMRQAIARSEKRATTGH